MNVQYRVDLSQEERAALSAMIGSGTCAVRRIKRAQILLAADAGACDDVIASTVAVGGSTVTRTKRAFVEENLEAALGEAPRPGADRKLSGSEEALLVATACAKPPAGRARWTLQLLADEMVALTGHDGLSRETVRRRLAENALKPWQKKMWCIPKLDATYVARMEDVLDLYAEPPDPARPVVCFDEAPVQLIGETREPVPARPGRPARVDYEYRRMGTANLFVALDNHRGWRKVWVSDRRASQDFAHRMRDQVDVHYPDAETIRVVMDNLTGSASKRYSATARSIRTPSSPISTNAAPRPSSPSIRAARHRGRSTPKCTSGVTSSRTSSANSRSSNASRCARKRPTETFSAMIHLTAAVIGSR